MLRLREFDDCEHCFELFDPELPIKLFVGGGVLAGIKVDGTIYLSEELPDPIRPCVPCWLKLQTYNRVEIKDRIALTCLGLTFLKLELNVNFLSHLAKLEELKKCLPLN